MSERLLDLAVDEVVEELNLPEDHFLRNPANITAVKRMIRGDATKVPAEKRWLYTIVCNEQSGAFNLSSGPICLGHLRGWHFRPITETFPSQKATANRWKSMTVMLAIWQSHGPPVCRLGR